MNSPEETMVPVTLVKSEGKQLEGRRAIRTEEGGGVDGGGGLGVHLGEPGGHDAGAADDAQVPGLPQHGHHERRQDAEAGTGPDHVGHPAPSVAPSEGPREGRLRVDLKTPHTHTVELELAGQILSDSVADHRMA